MIQAKIQSTPASVAQLRSTPRQATSDEALIERIAAGDKLAMQALFARYRNRVFHFVLRMVRDHGLAEDLISEVFLDVWRQASRFEARSAVGTWILTIARYKAISALRRRPSHETLDEVVEIEGPGEGPRSTCGPRRKRLRMGAANTSSAEARPQPFTVSHPNRALL